MPGRSTSEYLQLLQSLLPRGRAWTRDLGSVLSQFLFAVAQELARLELSILSIVDQADPRYASDLLPNHEYDLGLPDECSKAVDTISERRRQAHTKLIALGGAHKQYFVDLAAALGYTTTIQEYPSAGLTSIFHWQMIIQYSDEAYLQWAECGAAISGDPISRLVLSDVLDCFIKRYKPAHTHVYFLLGGASFGQGFSLGFYSMYSEKGNTGAFDRSFGIDSDVLYGGAFNYDELGDDFDKPQ